jgi:hypothetical protein
LLFRQWDFNIRRSLAGVSLPKCAGDQLDNEEQEDKEKRAPTETRHNSSGSRIAVSAFVYFFRNGITVCNFEQNKKPPRGEA